MKEVLILTGACGVGKSTIALAWAKKKKGAIVDSDYLTEWILDPAFPHWSPQEEELVAKISSGIAIEYIKFGLSAAIDNVWSPRGIELLKRNIESQVEVNMKAVKLYCNLEENHRRDQLRIPDHQMGPRVDVLNQELNSYVWPEGIVMLDTSQLNIAQTIEAIENM